MSGMNRPRTRVEISHFDDAPHAPRDHETLGRLGWLRNGNKAARPERMLASQRCGARTRAGKPCNAPAMRNRKTGRRERCRMHGGASTGAKTPEGRERARLANMRHGERSKAVMERRRTVAALRREIMRGVKVVEALWRQRKRLERPNPPWDASSPLRILSVL